MGGINRRNFMAAAAGTAASLGALGQTARASSSWAPPPQVPLGNTGVTLSRVGQGTGMHGGNRQSDHSRMGFEKLVNLFRHGYERGITFFDMADLYGTHVYLKEAMRSIPIPREKVAILTKVWWRYDTPGESPGSIYKKIATATLERFRHEIGTDYLDIVLLHCMTTPDWVKQLEPYMDALSEAKDKKQVRAVGVSCHNLDALKVAAECPWVDVILARINPGRVMMDGSPEQVVSVLRRAKENGKAVIGMKILGEGKLAADPASRENCIRFAQNLGLLDTMTIGFEKPGEIDEALSLMHQYPAAKVATGV